MDHRTPRRLGLSRISPRIKPTPTKRSNETANTVMQSTPKANENIESTSKPAEDSFETPTKKQKVSLGRFVFTPKQQTPDVKNENKHEAEDTGDSTNSTVDDLKTEIQEMNERLEKYKKYSHEKKELERLIESWKAGGIRALEQLQAAIQPKQEFEQILEHFRLPVDIFGDITE